MSESKTWLFPWYVPSILGGGVVLEPILAALAAFSGAQGLARDGSVPEVPHAAGWGRLSPFSESPQPSLTREHRSLAID